MSKIFLVELKTINNIFCCIIFIIQLIIIVAVSGIFHANIFYLVRFILQISVFSSFLDPNVSEIAFLSFFLSLSKIVAFNNVYFTHIHYKNRKNIFSFCIAYDIPYEYCKVVHLLYRSFLSIFQACKKGSMIFILSIFEC